MDPNITSLIANIAGGVIANRISDYLKFTPNPTEEGIINIIAESQNSRIVTEKILLEARNIINIITKNGGKISLGEGKYQSRGATIKIENGGRIDMEGDASIRME